MTTTRERQKDERLSTAITRAILPWCVLFVAAGPLLRFRWPPYEWSGPFIRWLYIILNDLSLVLPFSYFAAGVAVARKLGHSRRVVRVALVVGLALGSVSYLTEAWVTPVVDDQHLATVWSEAEGPRQFGLGTPVGILRNLRFVEANPPGKYSLGVSETERQPPNILRWRLQLPIAMAVFGLINVFLGLLAAELTVDLKRGVRRTALLATGVLGGIAFFAAVVLAAPIEPFLSSGEFRPAVPAAWLPLTVPFAEGLLLIYLTRSRRYG